MLNYYQKQKNEIRMNYFNENYINTISLCKKLSKELKRVYNDCFQNINQNIGFCYYYMSKCYKQLKNIKESIKCAKKAIKHGLNRFYENDNFSIESKILLAENYEYINRKDKAIKNYKKCARFYKKIRCIDNRRQMIFRIAKLIKKPGSMLKIIQLTERQENPEFFEDDVINEYLDLIEYYVELGDFTQIALLISNIKDIKIKLEVAGGLKNLVPKIA